MYIRSLTALMDKSGLEQLELEKIIGDHVNMFGQDRFFRGNEKTEYR